MTHAINAAQSGTFKAGGDITINRLGFGAMRVTGPGIWGPPQDRAEAIRVLKRLPEIGVNFIDTADSYGPEVSENLLCETLHPYKGLLIATKGGLTRGGPNQWSIKGDPKYLRQTVINSLKRLKLDRIDLWQLHRIDSRVPQEEQFGVIRDMQNEGLIRHVGLSEVSVAEITAAQKFFNVATVQNRYNLVDRHSEDVLEHCTQHNIGFIPWFPLAEGGLSSTGSVVDAVARKMNATPSQIALAWILKRSPVMLPIPGTSKLKHLEENVMAASLSLSDEDFKSLDMAGRNAR
ncbi:MAG TPA: aldo/keto reductase [Steroidobacteraceae bacterium]|nr:aldo/keto reductase [Steroidobacteraceae bacterium]